MFYLTGDIHGSAAELDDRLYGIDFEAGDTILCLGDVSLVYGKHISDNLKWLMSEAYPHIEFLIMRGNHDTRYCRDFLVGRFGDGYDVQTWCGLPVIVERGYDNIKYLPDEGGMFVRNDQKCLVMPGAFSVDVDVRRALGYPYEEEELLTYGELDNLIRLSEKEDIDYVFSHTCPYTWYSEMDDLLLDGVIETPITNSQERAFDIVLENVRDTCKGWYYGHFHADREVDGMGHLLQHGVLPLGELG